MPYLIRHRPPTLQIKQLRTRVRFHTDIRLPDLIYGDTVSRLFQNIFHIGHLIRTVTDIIFDCQRLSLPETVEKEQNGYK